MIFGHLNINSLKYKHDETRELLTDNIDLMFLSETKLDNSWLSSIFKVDNFTIYRNDRNVYGGGILGYIRSDIPHRRRSDFELNYEGVESLSIEICINKKKLLYVCLYKPPKVSNDHLNYVLEETANKSQGSFDSVYILGDLNVNMLKVPNVVSNFNDIYGFTCLINEATCFKGNPTCLDVILTNNKRSITNTLNCNLGISDFHNMICGVTKMFTPSFKPTTIKYRSYKHFNEVSFINDVQSAPLHVSEIFDDVDDAVWFHNNILKDIIDQHAPIKKRHIKRRQAPFMNGELRRAINVKSMLHRKYLKYKSKAYWGKYKKQRNLVTELKKKSVKSYFEKKCGNIENGNPKQFWSLIKPFMSDTHCNNSNKIMLMENGEIVNDPKSVCDIFNEYFTNVTDQIATENPIDDTENIHDIVNMYRNHDSILKIKSVISELPETESFTLHTVTPDYIEKKLEKLNSNKSTGCDEIPAKVLKVSSNVLSISITVLVNRMINECCFPHVLKLAELSPIFKKCDMLNKMYYRPVSVLTILSKIFEIVLCDQLNSFMNMLLSKFLCAFRKNYGCKDVLVKVVEDFKYALEKNDYVGCILMDLSKAFDCLPHRLLLSKMHAYGISLETCNLFLSYLTNRYQRVKCGLHRSDWSLIKRGVPQGSILGPILFNVFVNDLLYFLGDKCNVYNYADDNSISVTDPNINVMKRNLSSACCIALDWFQNNHMQANPDKFQGIILSRKCITENDYVLYAGEKEIKCDHSVKLLGIQIDKELNFTEHVRNICKKASRQVNILSRLKHLLNTDSKMIIFTAFVLSNLNYCPTVWHECGLINSKKLEKVQERALRFVLNDTGSDYKALLCSAKRSTLFEERLKFILLEVYKCINNIEPCFLSHAFVTKEQPYNLRNDVILVQPTFNTVKYGKNSIKYNGAKFWNLLPNDIKNAENVKIFKSKLANWSMPDNFKLYT
jgi:hypothetical protein